MEEVLLDVLDDQLTHEELSDLQERTYISGDCSESEDISASFTRAFETRFANHFQNILSHGEGEGK